MLRLYRVALAYPEFNELTGQIIGCAIEVHEVFGPGLLESIYEDSLFMELSDRGFAVHQQRAIPVTYKGRKTSGVLRPDLIVSDTVIVEVKSVEKVLPVHGAQVLTYLKVTGFHIGLLFNFNASTLLEGMKRFSL